MPLIKPFTSFIFGCYYQSSPSISAFENCADLRYTGSDERGCVPIGRFLDEKGMMKLPPRFPLFHDRIGLRPHRPRLFPVASPLTELFYTWFEQVRIEPIVWKRTIKRKQIERRRWGVSGKKRNNAVRDRRARLRRRRPASLFQPREPKKLLPSPYSDMRPFVNNPLLWHNL